MINFTFVYLTILFTMHIIINSSEANTSSKNILALTPSTSKSHHIWNRVIILELVKRGYNVTYFGPYAEKHRTKNLTHILIEGIYEKFQKNFDIEELTKYGRLLVMHMLFNWAQAQCDVLLKTKALRELESYRPGSFDLVIVDLLGTECLLPIIERIGSPPVVATSPFGHTPWLTYSTGDYVYPSFVPNYASLQFTDHMNLKERLINFLINAYTMFYRKHSLLPYLEHRARGHFNYEFTPLSELEKNISVYLLNSDPLMDWPRPNMPQVIEVAGLHIQPPKPLPKDIKQFLDEAKNGAIIFSLGSNVRSDKMSPEKIQSILEAFSRIPQRIIWKWESDKLPNKPENVMIRNWLPQSDILVHPNIVALITHGGTLSLFEAQARGIPSISIPIFFDQQSNTRRFVARGLGVSIKYSELTADTLENAIKEVTNNSQYKMKAKQASTYFNDQPETPLNRAIYWIEYVLRHGGAQHLHAVTKNMPFYKTYSIDVILILLIGVVTILITSILILFAGFKLLQTKVGAKIKTS